VWNVDPVEACGGRPVGLAWFSPDCKHFSKAAGNAPKSKRVRGLAWVVTRWAREVKPRVIMLENVEEFETWGPLDERGRPKTGAQKNKKGRPFQGLTFRRWVSTLRRLGYVVEWRPMSACDYGAPTTRRRLFIIARCDGRPIVWPGETHGPGTSKEWRTAAEIIDWSLPCRSIFDPERRPLAANTLARIADGIQRYVVDAAEPFIVRNGHYFANRATTFRGQGLTRPLATVCATNDKNLVLPYLRKPGGRTASTQPLVAAFMAKHYTGVVGHGLRRPIGTVTAKDHHSLVTAFLVKFYRNRQLQSATQPLHTVTPTARFGLVEVRGVRYEIADIGMRMLSPRELFNAQGFPGSYDIDCVSTQTAQIKLAGNSVCPPVSRTLVAANLAA
jgi:DNA (cytosine-5)-methyltransferase 1